MGSLPRLLQGGGRAFEREAAGAPKGLLHGGGRGSYRRAGRGSQRLAGAPRGLRGFLAGAFTGS